MHEVDGLFRLDILQGCTSPTLAPRRNDERIPADLRNLQRQAIGIGGAHRNYPPGDQVETLRDAEFLTHPEQHLHAQTDTHQRYPPGGNLTRNLIQASALQFVHAVGESADARQDDPWCMQNGSVLGCHLDLRPAMLQSPAYAE